MNARASGRDAPAGCHGALERVARRLAVVAVCAFAAPHVAATDAYTFPLPFDARAVATQCRGMLNDLARAQKAFARSPALSDAEVLAQLDAMTIRYEDTLGPLSVLAAVSPRKSIRDASDACDLSYQKFSSRFLQDATVYARLRQVEPADEIDRRLLRDALDAFEDAGVALSAAQKSRVRVLNDELTRLSQQFERRLREDRTALWFTEAELAGVPRDVWETAPRRGHGKDKRYRLGLAEATVYSVLRNATVAATRERLWRAASRMGGRANLDTLSAIAKRRRELASIFGQASYADFALRHRMAHDEAEVQAFLATVKEAVRERELSDLGQLRAEKSLATGGDGGLDRWDVAFYSERARRTRHAVDQDEFRRYFPPDASLRFVYRIAERLFGINVTPAASDRAPALWHPDVQMATVTDSATGDLLGTLFVDLYPRADKYNHAAVWGFRNVSTLTGRLPAAALVVNFNRQGLSLDELETLLHEFGHALHGLLSKTRYASQGGTSVQLDFVEAPSQMLEDWVYDPKVVALFAEVCPACTPVPDDLLARAKAARSFGKGQDFSRQHLYASYDLALHGRDAVEPLPLWAAMDGATPQGYVPGSMFPASFEHIASGYAAGYYGYLWSLVLAEDLRTVFADDRLSPQIGERYRKTVLENGGQVAPAELLRSFLGRPTNSRAFFESLAR